jgi:hypothetical protein
VEEGGSFFGLGFADGALGVEDFGGDAFCGEEFPEVFLGEAASFQTAPCRGGKSPPSEEGGYSVPVTARRLLFQNHLDVRVVNLGPGFKGWMKRSAVTWKKAARFLAWVLLMARLAWKTSEVMPFVAKSFRGCFWVGLRAFWTAPCC